MLYRRFPVKRAISMGLLLLVALLGFIALNRVKIKAFQIVEYTLPGLSDAGVANSYVADDFNHLIMALMSSVPQERVDLCAKAASFESEAAKSLKSYENSIFDDEDQANFGTLMERRKEYLEMRQQVLELMNRGGNQEALKQYKQSLLPLYNRYMTAGYVVLDYNARQGKERGNGIMHFSNFAQYAVAAFTVALFILGFVLGVFKYDPVPRSSSRSIGKPLQIM